MSPEAQARAKAKRAEAPVEDVRTGTGAATLQRAIVDNLTYVQGRLPSLATRHDWYMALAHAVRDRLLHRWVRTVETYSERDVKVVAYLSAEFLVGPHLGNNLATLEVPAIGYGVRYEFGIFDQEGAP